MLVQVGPSGDPQSGPRWEMSTRVVPRTDAGKGLLLTPVAGQPQSCREQLSLGTGACCSLGFLSLAASPTVSEWRA